MKVFARILIAMVCIFILAYRFYLSASKEAGGQDIATALIKNTTLIVDYDVYFYDESRTINFYLESQPNKEDIEYLAKKMEKNFCDLDMQGINEINTNLMIFNDRFLILSRVYTKSACYQLP